MEKHRNCSKLKQQTQRFSSPLSLGLLKSVPRAKSPVEAILWHAEMLFVESGMSKPPFPPANYAPLRRVKEIVLKSMEVDGRLIPSRDGFVIELRKDRPHERRNFTCAHELGHTFFYESVPAIKYRAVSTNQPHHDGEEERLCNIAAAELLMPRSVFSKIAKDYSASPQSLREVAEIFEVSLTAIAVNILKNQIWNATFILWKHKNNKLEAEWMVQPKRSLIYSPQLETFSSETSRILHTLKTGELTKNPENLKSKSGFLSGVIQSMRLNNSTVLSCINHNSTVKFKANSQIKQPSQELPIDYECKCNGTRWIIINQNGKTSAMRCPASKHKSNSFTNECDPLR